MSDWVTKPLADLIEGHWSGEWGVDPVEDVPVARVYKSTEIDDAGHLRATGGVFRSIPNAKNPKRIKTGDILVEASGGAPDRPVGRVAYTDFLDEERRFTSNFVRTLRPQKNVHGKFLNWRLHWLNQQPQILRYQQQTTGIINLQFADYLRHEIFLPKNLDEQKTIAQVLDAIDTQIETTEGLIAKQERVRAGLMQDLFTRGVDEHGQLRPPRDQAPHLYHQTELGWLPLGWEVMSIQSAVRNIIDYRGVPPPKADSGVPLITAKNVRFGYLDIEPQEYIAEADFNSWMRRGIPSAGDVIFTTEAPLGNVAQIPEYKLALGQRTLTLQPNLDFVGQHYLKWALMSERMQERIKRLQSGSTATGIQSKTFRTILLELPPIPEQEVILGHLTRASAKEDVLFDDVAKLRLQKSGLMQDLLTGKVSVAPLLESAA